MTWRCLGLFDKAVAKGGVPLSPMEMNPAKYGYKVGPLRAFKPDAPLHSDFLYWQCDNNQSNYLKSMELTTKLQNKEIQRGQVSSFYMMHGYNCGMNTNEVAFKRKDFGEKELNTLQTYIRTKVDDYYEKQYA